MAAHGHRNNSAVLTPSPYIPSYFHTATPYAKVGAPLSGGQWSMADVSNNEVTRYEIGAVN